MPKHSRSSTSVRIQNAAERIIAGLGFEVKDAQPPVFGIGIGQIGHDHVEIVTEIG